MQKSFTKRDLAEERRRTSDGAIDFGADFKP
jgi:hypothetical protein